MQITDIRSKLPRNGSYMRRPLGAIKEIAVHWDAQWRPHEYDSVARYAAQAQRHIDKDWGGGSHGDGLMYALKIDNCGEVFQCRDFEDVLWNVGGNPNYYTLAINLDGTTGQNPTREQIESLNRLLDWLCFEHPEFPATQGDVHPHRYYGATECPGDRIIRAIDEYNSTRKCSVDDLSYDWPVQVVENPVPQPTVEPPKEVAETPAPNQTFPENKPEVVQTPIEEIKTQPEASTEVTEPNKETEVESKKFSINKADIISTLITVAMVAGSAVVAWALDAIAKIDLGTATVVVVPVLTSILKLVQKYLQGEK